MAQGTLDVTTGLQKRTNPSKIDRLLMVNPETAEPQYIEMDQVTGQVRGDMLPAFDLDNIRVMTSTAPDGKLVKSNVLDPITGGIVTFKEIDTSDPLDGITIISHGGKKYADAEYLKTGSLNLPRYGLIGDGVSDNYASLQLIIDTAHSLGIKSVQLPSNGVFVLESRIELRGSIIIDGGNCLIKTNGIAFNAEVDIEDLYIKNIRAECTGTVNNFLRVDANITNVNLENVRVKNMALAHLRQSTNELLRVINCDADVNGGELNALNVGSTKYVMISGSRFRNSAFDGIKFAAEFSEYISINACWFINCGDDGIDFFGGGRRATVTNSFFIGIQAYGILLKTGDDTVSASIEDFTLSGNRYYNGVTAPIGLIAGARRISITNEKVFGYGNPINTLINISGTCEDIIFSGNQFYDVVGVNILGLRIVYSTANPYQPGVYELNPRINISNNIFHDGSSNDFMQIVLVENVSMSVNIESNAITKKGTAGTAIRIGGKSNRPTFIDINNNTIDGYSTFLRPGATFGAVVAEGYTVTSRNNKLINVTTPIINTTGSVDVYGDGNSYDRDVIYTPLTSNTNVYADGIFQIFDYSSGSNRSATMNLTSKVIGTKKRFRKTNPAVSVLTINPGTGVTFSGATSPVLLSRIGEEVEFIYNGSGVWLVSYQGQPLVSSGTTANRPLLTSIPIGFPYFDTTLGKNINKKDDTTWVDATGATV